MHGPEGVQLDTRIETITKSWLTNIQGDADFVMPTMR